MKIVELTQEVLDRWPERKGACCGRALRPGQWVIVDDRKPPGVFVDCATVLHVSCVRTKTADVPEDTAPALSPEVEFGRERRRLMAAAAAGAE